MKICYNEATAMGCSNLMLDLELCEKAGFDYIELRLDMLSEYLKQHSLLELAAYFETHRIKPHALNALYVYPEFLGDNDDAEKQKSLLDEFYFGLEACKAIGSHHFIVVPPLQRNPQCGPFVGTREETFANCVRILQKLGSIAQGYDVKLCFELVGFNRSSVRSIAEVNAIVEAVNRENVGFVFDSYNIYLNGCTNDFAELQIVPVNKIFAVHLMSGLDVPENEMGQDKRCFPDRGVVNIDNFLQNLYMLGYTGMVSVETFNPEYWKESPRWVIDMAYQTARYVLTKNGCAG